MNKFDEPLESRVVGLRDCLTAKDKTVIDETVSVLLHELGWPKLDAISTVEAFRKLDHIVYILCNQGGSPVVLFSLSLLGPASADTTESQLITYAFEKKVGLVFQTDGNQWSMHYVERQLAISSHQFREFNLERDGAEICARALERFFHYRAIELGKTVSYAVSALKTIHLFPSVWHSLKCEEDAFLKELILDKFLYSFKPDIKVIDCFLRGDTGESTGSNKRCLVIDKHCVRFKGKYIFYKSQIHKLMEVYKCLDSHDEGFLERFSNKCVGDSRRLVAKDKFDLYVKSPHLCDKYAKKLNATWWISTNFNSAQISKIIELACETACVEYVIDHYSHETNEEIEKITKKFLPEVWVKLKKDEFEFFRESIFDRFQSRHGFLPESEVVEGMLGDIV